MRRTSGPGTRGCPPPPNGPVLVGWHRGCPARAGRNDGDHGRPVRRKHRLAANLNPVGPAAAGVLPRARGEKRWRSWSAGASEASTRRESEPRRSRSRRCANGRGGSDRYATLGTLTLVKIAKSLSSFCSVPRARQHSLVRIRDYDCMPKRGGADEIPVIAEGAPALRWHERWKATADIVQWVSRPGDLQDHRAGWRFHHRSV